MRSVKAKHRLAITAHPSPLNRVFHEKLIVSQTTNIFYSFYGIRRFITVFTRAHPPIVPILSQMTTVQNTASICKMHFNIFLDA
jgi:hypothetical protein